MARLYATDSYDRVLHLAQVMMESIFDGDELRVATGHGTIRILELQAEGKRPMTVREFLAGHQLAVGDRFTSKATNTNATQV